MSESPETSSTKRSKQAMRRLRVRIALRLRAQSMYSIHRLDTGSMSGAERKQKTRTTVKVVLIFVCGLYWTRTSVPFAQWSWNVLGADIPLPFALTNSGRFRLRRTAHWADASFVCLSNAIQCNDEARDADTPCPHKQIRTPVKGVLIVCGA